MRENEEKKQWWAPWRAAAVRASVRESPGSGFPYLANATVGTHTNLIFPAYTMVSAVVA